MLITNHIGRRNRHVRHRQKGVGLVEVLIAVLILSFGLLGIAVLQMRTLKNNQSAYQRSMAVIQMHAMADALRSDRNNAKDFNIAIDAAAPTDLATFPKYALKKWRKDLLDVLGPNSNATGSVDCTGVRCDIVVRWNDERGSGGSNIHQLETRVQL